VTWWDLGGLGLQHIIRHPGALEGHLASGGLQTARIGPGIAQGIGYRPYRRLWHRLDGRGSRRSCGPFHPHLSGMLTALFGRIGLGAPFLICPRGVDRAVGQGGDPAGSTRFAHGPSVTRHCAA